MWNRPKKPFDRTRIEYEAGLKKEYGFKRKKEIWKIKQYFKNIKRRARTILATHNKEEEKILMARLQRYGIADKKFTLDDVLNLSLEDFCERRLQTIVHKKGLANTIKEARQMITHRRILVGKAIIDQPNYLVNVEDEKKISVKKKAPKPKVEEKPAEEPQTDSAPEDAKIENEEETPKEEPKNN